MKRIGVLLLAVAATACAAQDTSHWCFVDGEHLLPSECKKVSCTCIGNNMWQIGDKGNFSSLPVTLTWHLVGSDEGAAQEKVKAVVVPGTGKNAVPKLKWTADAFWYGFPLPSVRSEMIPTLKPTAAGFWY